MPITIDGTNGISDVRSTTDGTAVTPAIRGTDTNTGIFFPAADTIAFTEGGVESMRIDSSGNVGIGTSSPTLKLSIGIASGTGGINHIYTGAGGPYSVANFTSNLDTGEVQIGGVRTNYFPTFYSSGSERMRIDSSGNLLVGTTTITGVGGFALRPNNSAGSATLSLNRNSNASSSTAFVFETAAVTVGSITYSNTATSFNTSSDYRLKENIAPMQNALSVVQQLKPVTYNWKVDGSIGQGFIAHELQAVIPDCVTGEKDAVETYTDEEGNEQTRPKYQGIDTSFLVATLTAAIQELKTELDSVKATVDLLSTEVATLKGAA